MVLWCQVSSGSNGLILSWRILGIQFASLWRNAWLLQRDLCRMLWRTFFSPLLWRNSTVKFRFVTLIHSFEHVHFNPGRCIYGREWEMLLFLRESGREVRKMKLWKWGTGGKSLQGATLLKYSAGRDLQGNKICHPKMSLWHASYL